MKRKSANRCNNNRRSSPKNTRNDRHVAEMLRLCLQRVCELQEELERSDEINDNTLNESAEAEEDPEDLMDQIYHHQDPEAAGYAACATEAIRFLENQGLSNDHPVVRRLRERLNLAYLEARNDDNDNRVNEIEFDLLKK